LNAQPTLVSRHTLWLASGFTALALGLAALFTALVAWPMANRAADDLAGLMVLSAQTWAELPPETRGAFAEELRARHGLELRPRFAAVAPDEWHTPMIRLLENALNRRLPARTHLHREQVGEDVWYWINLPVGQSGLAVGLPRDRYDSRPLLMLAAGIAASLVMAWMAAHWLARRMAAPVERLEQAMAVVGMGGTPQPLAEDGPRELARLSRHFNRMAAEVDELIRARTTLLAGISHDLRTPLARMRLALQILREQSDPAMLDRLEADLEKTNRLIGDVLDLARGLALEEPRPIDLRGLLEALAAEHATPDTPIVVSAQAVTVLAARTALARALGNLLQNGQRYAASRPIDLIGRLEADALRLGVLDRGPGIPAAEIPRMLQPFQRLEPSRSAATGGSGLGLAIVRELARANGWTLELAAREGAGLAVWLTLPRARVTPAAPEA